MKRFWLYYAQVALKQTAEFPAASSHLAMVLQMVSDRGEIRAPQTSIGFVTVKDGCTSANQYLVFQQRAKWV